LYRSAKPGDPALHRASNTLGRFGLPGSALGISFLPASQQTRSAARSAPGEADGLPRSIDRQRGDQIGRPIGSAPPRPGSRMS